MSLALSNKSKKRKQTNIETATLGKKKIWDVYLSADNSDKLRLIVEETLKIAKHIKIEAEAIWIHEQFKFLEGHSFDIFSLMKASAKTNKQYHKTEKRDNKKKNTSTALETLKKKVKY